MSKNNHYTISVRYTGSRLPLFQTAVLYLLLKNWSLPPWFWGMFWTIIALWWCASLYNIVQEKVGTPIFYEDLKPNSRSLLFPPGE